MERVDQSSTLFGIRILTVAYLIATVFSLLVMTLVRETRQTGQNRLPLFGGDL